MAQTQSKSQVALVLQGGGALGAYQGGAFAGLAGHGYDIDWVVGTSIGAINGAIIAGNRPEQRVEKLQAFWQFVSSNEPSLLPHLGTADWMRPWTNTMKTMNTLKKGVPGFFQPRPGSTWNLQRTVLATEASFYDTSPLEGTLRRFVDFDYLNAGHVRFTVCAVNVATGEIESFDNSKGKPITPQHVMASGALPPGFPPVMIDGAAYWDGGIYSNSPIDVVLDDARRHDTLCFMIDLWDPTESLPNSIAAAIHRHKNIQYSSRTREHLEEHRQKQNLRRAVRILADQLPAKARDAAALKPLVNLGSDSTIRIVRMVMKAMSTDSHTKDIDFSRPTVTTRWAAGHHDALRALRHKNWLKPLPPHLGMAIHELAQE